MDYDFTRDDFFYIACILRSRTVELQLTLEKESLTTEQRKALEEAFYKIKKLYSKCKHAESHAE